MESYRTEEEQVEALKKWWDENGRTTLIGVALALGLGFGWQAWQQNQQQAQDNASALYQQMLQALSTAEETSPDAGKELATQIKDEYRGSTYAQFAALHLARLAVYDDDLAGAERELRWVLTMAEVGGEIHQTAQLRLARVAAAQGDTGGALTMLQAAESEFVTSYAQARGDILLADGREQEALLAYQSALASLDPTSPAPTTLTEKVEYLTARLPSEAASLTAEPAPAAADSARGEPVMDAAVEEGTATEAMSDEVAEGSGDAEQ
ncbi:MAG: tetratricopeptide repeat protein [Pseudomonadota bacterium]